ncbi:MAG: molecular chaperone DnaJ [Candidatus Peregrinibacteria bacterium]|nr:molecular chaperone DnaJ [Candidatus Peregrinibacteria bacterium]MCB9807840.1 molecular chaperone DnaJ [Candidatus Peribacteria bacterium]
MARDYYSILGIEKSASAADIKKAYRNLSKQWHPDKHKGDKDAEAKFKEINEAYEVLGNEKRRKQYDTFGAAGGSGGGGQGFGGFDFSGFQQGDFGGFGDIFETFFGGGAGGRGRTQRSQRGEDIQVRIAIEFAEVLHGCKKTIAISTFVSCTDCQGSGSQGGKTVSCSECGGTGQVVKTAQSFFGTIQQAMMCRACNGAGQVPEKPCTTCKAEGRVQQKREVTIDIPAGIDDGQTLRITGEGNAGKHGTPAGDLFVIIQVKPDARFERHGNDIHSIISIPVVDAILGTDISVPTVHGNVILSVPAGTQPKQVLRMKGKGLPQVSSSRMGDQYITINIDIPQKLSRQEKKLMEEWRKIV